jgi:hypothetical protein
MKRLTHLTALSLMIYLVAGLTACTKKEIVPLEELPNNRILTYKVVNGTETYLGAIDNVGNTITVYVPYSSGIEYLVPVITLEEGASLLDSAGNKINLDGGVQPVSVAATGYTYSVSATDRSIRKYTLITKVQPYGKKLVVGYTLNWETRIIDTVTSMEHVPGGKFYLYGNFESTSTNIRLTATNRTTGKVSTDIFKVSDITTSSDGYYSGLVDIAISADTGIYDIHMQQQGRTATLAPVHIFYKKPSFGILSSRVATLSPGDTLTLKVISTGNTSIGYCGINVGLKRAYMKFNRSALSEHPANLPDSLLDTPLELKITESSFLQVKFILPKNIPIGTYSGSISSGSSIENGFVNYYGALEFYFDYEDWTGFGSNNLLGLGYVLYVVPPKTN